MRRRKLTAADRPEFRREVAGTIAKLGIGVAELDSDMAMVCSKAEDFDPSTNVLWEQEGNKSAVRQMVRCHVCDSALAVSNDLYARYLKLDKKPRAFCPECLLKNVT